VVSMPSVPPVFVTFHEPSRQPSADVVVVAGAGGADPAGVTIGEPDGVEEASLADGLGDPVSAGEDGDAELLGDTTAVGTVVGDADGPPRPIWPHTAPAMRPITAVIARATRTIAPAGIEPRESRRRVITSSA
jgi:hypothetical protein